MLGVTASTPVPVGHRHASCAVPLLWLFRRRWQQLGRRLANTTKETLDADSDYFVLSADASSVMSTLRPTDALKFSLDLSLSTDWVIVNADSFADARLVSVDAAVDPLIARTFEKQFGSVLYDHPFDFPALTVDNAKELDFDGSGSVADQAHVDATVARLQQASPNGPGQQD